ncbi:MAG TPA: DUF2934 domain-containing protein [Azospirillaceae bacterium]|nr:DUF2934 domain-containing protein [Azospirillaceae bacterium]
MSQTVEGRIQQRAYEIWEREGRPHGRDWEHWLMAEGEVAGQSVPAPAAAKDAQSDGKQAAPRLRARKAKASG